MPKEWKTLTELRGIAKDAGVKSVHKKDAPTLLEALTAAGVEVCETPTDGKSATVVEKEETATNGKDTAKETKPETKKAGGKGSDVEKCRERIAKAKAELLAARSALKDALKAEAKAGKAPKVKSHIELLNESKKADEKSEAIAKAREIRTLRRLARDGRQAYTIEQAKAQGKVKK